MNDKKIPKCESDMCGNEPNTCQKCLEIICKNEREDERSKVAKEIFDRIERHTARRNYTEGYWICVRDFEELKQKYLKEE